MPAAGRKHLPHLPPLEFHNRPVIVMVTVCAYRPERIFDNAHAHEFLREIWRGAASQLVGRYVLMPDHIHFFCAPGEVGFPLKKWMNHWKRRASLRWPETRATPVFQRDFFDRQLRAEENYDAAWEYVRENPVRAGLVANADEWPHQGEICVLPW